ncbi:hypothetical protein R5W24_004435 [Gemmata sp. JC717]|uniref:hypothetical protein n=1 Tax=Gemmata algarum TaxID=2975278 RepID=UPI0021BAE19B|nr:hypothetical protein [Gemmata algarum]MDY3555294.1 hypothetical protein [Gemmata algarum]
MPAIIVTAFTPAASRDTVEAAVAPYLTSPNNPGVYTFSVPLVPLDGPDDAEPTHYGTCARAEGGGTLAGALASLAAAFPGSAYQSVSPWKSFNNATHWIGWLAGLGLKPRVTTL